LASISLNTKTNKEQENVAYQALIGIINTGLTSPYQDLAISAIQQAARQGQGRVQATASEYLLTHGSI
jgi:hypothetical protein